MKFISLLAFAFLVGCISAFSFSINSESSTSATHTRRNFFGVTGVATAALCGATLLPNTASASVSAPDAKREEIANADAKFNNQYDREQDKVQNQEETTVQKLDQTKGQVYDEAKIEAKEQAKTKAFGAGGSEAKTIAGADEKVTRGAGASTGAAPTSKGPSAASSSSGAGVGVVSGSVPGGRVLPKEEVNSGIWNFLKVRYS